MANRIYQFRMVSSLSVPIQNAWLSTFLLALSVTCMKHALLLRCRPKHHLESHILASYGCSPVLCGAHEKRILRLRIKYDFGMRMMHIVRMEIILRLIKSLTAQAPSCNVEPFAIATGNYYEFSIYFFLLFFFYLHYMPYALMSMVCCYTSYFHILEANSMLFAAGECVDCIILQRPVFSLFTSRMKNLPWNFGFIHTKIIQHVL